MSYEWYARKIFLFRELYRFVENEPWWSDNPKFCKYMRLKLYPLLVFLLLPDFYCYSQQTIKAFSFRNDCRKFNPGAFH